MSPANRPGGRERRTVSGGGNVYRRGSGLGGSGVGGGGRIGGGGSSGGSGGDRGFGNGGGGLLAVILALLIGGASNNNNQNGTGGANRTASFDRVGSEHGSGAVGLGVQGLFGWRTVSRFAARRIAAVAFSISVVLGKFTSRRNRSRAADGCGRPQRVADRTQDSLCAS